MGRRHLSVLVAAATIFAAPVQADEVRLKNGDRLTGEVATLDRGTLTFRMPHGDLRIDWAEVVSLTVDASIVASEADGTKTTLPGGPIDVATVVHLERPEPPLSWVGGVNAGILATSGNTDVNSQRLDGELVGQARKYRYTFNALVNRSEDAGRQTARNWTFSGGYDRYIIPRFYVNGSAIFTSDAFRDLELRTAISVGLGYEVLSTSRIVLALEGGVGWVNEAFEPTPDDSYTSLRESGRVDVFLGARRVVLFHRHDGYFGVTGDDNLFFKMQNGLRLGLFGGLVTTVQLDIDYDRSPAPERGTTDRTFALTFGYRF